MKAAIISFYVQGTLPLKNLLSCQHEELWLPYSLGKDLQEPLAILDIGKSLDWNGVSETFLPCHIITLIRIL